MSKVKRSLLRLFFDFEFTSLSPDALPISLGIVSDDIHKQIGSVRIKGGYSAALEEIEPKQFYAEFNDFDINRCDDWVKENVVKKLNIPKENDGHLFFTDNPDDYRVIGSTYLITTSLRQWLEQFKGYNIQFIADCGTFDWYWMLQLIGEWKQSDDNDMPDTFSSECVICKGYICLTRYGLPKLPKNISPIPQDLNDFIAYKKGISIRKAFELDRSWLANDYTPKSESSIVVGKDMVKSKENKHNSLWDAKVTKMIFNNLK